MSLDVVSKARGRIQVQWREAVISADLPPAQPLPLLKI
jgi:hypothetical protein